jgi:hypothetical protein
MACLLLDIMIKCRSILIIEQKEVDSGRFTGNTCSHIPLMTNDTMTNDQLT